MTRKHGRSIVWGKKCFKAGFHRVERGVLSQKKGKVIPDRGAEDGKGMRTYRGKSKTRNMEAESISRDSLSGLIVSLV